MEEQTKKATLKGSGVMFSASTRMRARAVRRPPNGSPLKKRPPVQEEPQDKKRILLPSLNDPPEEEHDDPAYYNARVELEEDDLQFEPEEEHQAALNFYGNDSHGEGMEGVEKDGDEKGKEADVDNMMEDEEEGGDEEDEHIVTDEDEERHDVVLERRRRKELEVFVGGLDRDATEEDLKVVFSKVGELTEVRLIKNPLTQKNKGFAFLRFATVEQARRAINELKQPTINGKQCGVAPSQDKTTLYIGNICKTWTKEILMEKIAKYGIDKFEDLTLIKDTKNEGLNRGFAFLDFSSRSDALDACKRLHQRDAVFGTDRTAKVSFADPLIESDDEIMAQVKKIFIDGLPASWNEERLTEHLQKFGKIDKVELSRNMPAAKRTDFGFITFDSHDSAVDCVEGINGTELSDGKKKVKIRARLSRPRHRGLPGKRVRGAHSIRSGGNLDGQSRRAHGMYCMDSWKFVRHSGHGIQNDRTFGGGYKWPLSPKRRHPVAYVASDRLGSRRVSPPPKSTLGRRSPVPTHGRDVVRHKEPFSRSSDFASRTTTERCSTYMDGYRLHGSEYLDRPQRASRGASCRTTLCEEGYGQLVKRPSYQDSRRHNYSSISGAKRPRYAVDDLQPHYGDAEGRQARARCDYGGSNAALQYGESDYYGSEPTRTGRGSHLEYKGSSPCYVGHSHELYDSRTSNLRYSRGGESKEYEGLHSSYDRDRMPSREDLHDGPYSSLYSRRGSKDVYLRGRRSGSYN